MAKTKKENPAAENQEAVIPEMDGTGSVMPGQPLKVEFPRDRLFELYLARVAKAETVMTMRRNGKDIFRDAFNEAKCAYEVWVDMTNGGNE